MKQTLVSAALAAADSAQGVLQLFEAVCPGDDRPRMAIEAARSFADDRISEYEMSLASDRAACSVSDLLRVCSSRGGWTAAHAAARDAAYAAYWSASAFMYSPDVKVRLAETCAGAAMTRAGR